MIEISEHAFKRLSERSGLSKKAAYRIAEKAFTQGITHSETKGNLNKYITSLYFNNTNANNIRLYGDKVYIFVGEVLVTVLQIPSNLTKDMKKLVRRKQ